jgi:hypothetical protein
MARNFGGEKNWQENLIMPSNFLLNLFRKKKAETETQQDIQENIFIFSQLFRSVYHTCNTPCISD